MLKVYNSLGDIRNNKDYLELDKEEDSRFRGN